MTKAVAPPEPKPSKFAWSNVFYVPFGTREFYVGMRPGQGTYSIRFEHDKKPIVRALKTTDPKTATKNAEHLLKQVFNTDWAEQERVRKLSRNKTMATVLPLYLKKLKGKSAAHTKGAKQILEDFQTKFGSRELSAIRAADIDAYLTETTNLNSRAKYFTYLFGFWRWADRVEHVDGNPMTRLDRPKTTPRRNILTVEQMKEILDASDRMEPWLHAAMLLGAFAGVRTAEICRMNWEDVDMARLQIDIREAKSSEETPFAERIIDILGPIERRAAVFADLTGPIVPREAVAGSKTKNPDLDLSAWFCTERAKFVAGVLKWDKWPENCLRHSFATYLLAVNGNPNLTAFQMGHSSPTMVRKVYAVPAKRVVAAPWWSL